MTRRFVELDGSPAAQAALDAWLLVSPGQLGPVRAAHQVPAASRAMNLLLLGLPRLLGRGRGPDVLVRQHGLEVAGRAVPFATMDPGRMVWATSVLAARQVVTRNRRRRVAGGEILLLNGTDGPDAVNDWEGLGTMYDPLPRAPRLDTPFVWWCLGPVDLPGFVRDLEMAMVADGYPVHGLADHLARHRWAPDGRGERFPRRAAGDPVLWGR